MKKATDDQIIDSYGRHKSVWKVAAELGMCGQSVYERLKRLGVDTSTNVFTEEDEEYLAERYVPYRDAGKLQDLADEMGRTKQFICRQAGRLGLTDPKSKRTYLEVFKNAPESFCLPIWNDFKRSRFGVSAFCKSRHYNIQSFTDAMRRCFPEEYESVVESKRPKRTKYAIGRDFEYATRDVLAKLGYLVVRSPASKSPVDLYAFKKGELVFVQCKVHGACAVDEWNEFLEYCQAVSALPILAERGPGDRGVKFHRITGKKDGSKKAQPYIDWDPSGKDGN